jgi:hypothetical protein
MQNKAMTPGHATHQSNFERKRPVFSSWHKRQKQHSPNADIWYLAGCSKAREEPRPDDAELYANETRQRKQMPIDNVSSSTMWKVA